MSETGRCHDSIHYTSGGWSHCDCGRVSRREMSDYKVIESMQHEQLKSKCNDLVDKIAAQDAALAERDAEIAELKSSMIGNKVCELIIERGDLRAKVDRAVAALDLINRGGLEAGVPGTVQERMLTMCELSATALAALRDGAASAASAAGEEKSEPQP